MATEPTINDFFDLIRPPLEAKVEFLRRDIKAIDNRVAASGQTGAGTHAREFEGHARRHSPDAGALRWEGD